MVVEPLKEWWRQAASLPAACASSALSSLANALASTRHANLSSAPLSALITTVEHTLVAILRETAAGLLDGAAAASASPSAATSITRSTFAGRAWAAASLPPDAVLPEGGVGYEMPPGFESEAGLGFLHPVDVFLGMYPQP